MYEMRKIGQQAERPDDWRKPQSEGASRSGPDPAYCLRKAQMLFACYRKDEAHDPMMYSAAVAAIFEGYSREVVERAADPRTGIASQFKFLPAVAEVREFCDAELARHHRMAQPPIPRKSVPISAPKLLAGQISYAQFLEMAARGEAKPRAIGRFEVSHDRG